MQLKRNWTCLLKSLVVDVVKQVDAASKFCKNSSFHTKNIDKYYANWNLIECEQRDTMPLKRHYLPCTNTDFTKVVISSQC